MKLAAEDLVIALLIVLSYRPLGERLGEKGSSARVLLRSASGLGTRAGSRPPQITPTAAHTSKPGRPSRWPPGPTPIILLREVTHHSGLSSPVLTNDNCICVSHQMQV